MDVTCVIGNNSWKFHDDMMIGTWWKRCDGRTDRRTDEQTAWTSHIAAWSQLKRGPWCKGYPVQKFVIPWQLNDKISLFIKQQNKLFINPSLLVKPCHRGNYVKEQKKNTCAFVIKCLSWDGVGRWNPSSSQTKYRFFCTDSTNWWCHGNDRNNDGISHRNKLISSQWRIYASVNWVSINSDNGLSRIRHQAIIWTNAGLMSINLSELT